MFTINVAKLKPHQRAIFLELVKSLFESYVIPSSDELQSNG
jgi:hypothetical protein